MAFTAFVIYITATLVKNLTADLDCEFDPLPPSHQLKLLDGDTASSRLFVIYTGHAK